MSSPLQLSFDLYNVFCYPDAEGKSRPFTGNPLAIIYVPEGVAASDSQLLTLARQFNLSETTFPSQAQGTNYSVKIYTIESELPFAGHPTVGTCMSMLDRGLISRPGVGQSITQQTLSGPIKLLTPTNDTVFFSSPLKFISPSPLATPPTLISSLCLPAATPITPTLRVSSCGLPFLYVQLEREEDLKLAKPNPTAIKSLIAGWKEDGATPCGIYLFWAGPLKEKSEGEVSVEIKGRMLFTDPGEDPATGSATIALGPFLLTLPSLGLEGRPSTTLHYSCTQGFDMGHPSRLYGRIVTDAEGKVSECWTGGSAVKVGEGWVALPEEAKI